MPARTVTVNQGGGARGITCFYYSYSIKPPPSCWHSQSTEKNYSQKKTHSSLPIETSLPGSLPQSGTKELAQKYRTLC